MTSRSNREPLASELAEALNLSENPRVILQWAQTFTLRMAFTMLRNQVANRRAMISTGELTPEVVDQTAREIQARVERIRLIVAELRGRGDQVEWDE